MIKQLFILFLILLSSPINAFADAQATALIQRVQDLLRSDTNISTYQIKIIKEDWQREMTIKAWDD
ncbi:MAG: hypothetical protein Q9M28_03110 [Mariprofundaceae bacterium]|nr:hypothetical protein [Mariprofundaceae bacterium]